MILFAFYNKKCKKKKSTKNKKQQQTNKKKKKKKKAKNIQIAVLYIYHFFSPNLWPDLDTLGPEKYLNLFCIVKYNTIEKIRNCKAKILKIVRTQKFLFKLMSFYPKNYVELFSHEQNQTRKKKRKKKQEQTFV